MWLPLPGLRVLTFCSVAFCWVLSLDGEVGSPMDNSSLCSAAFSKSLTLVSTDPPVIKNKANYVKKPALEMMAQSD